MTEIIVKDLCPHCGKKTIVWLGKESGSMHIHSCQHCDQTLRNRSWEETAWFLASELKPVKRE